MALAVTAALTACQAGSSSHPVPSVSTVGSDLNCAHGDQGVEDLEAGWGFCVPDTWRYIERSQGSDSPPGLDLTFDVTDVPCTSAQPTAGGSTSPVCSPNAGLFAFMIISTYERGTASSLDAWEQANLNSAAVGSQSITWGNSLEAQQFADGRRIAFTPHHVVILALHSGVGNLNLEAEISKRLDTWKFTY
jgi:hypothetical protein